MTHEANKVKVIYLVLGWGLCFFLFMHFHKSICLLQSFGGKVPPPECSSCEAARALDVAILTSETMDLFGVCPTVAQLGRQDCPTKAASKTLPRPQQ